MKGVSVGRATPYLLRTSDDNVLILGSGGTHGEALFSDIVDRLKGDPLQVPLLQQWHPLFYEAPFCSDLGFIGDEATDDYSWLVPVEDWTVGDSTNWLLNRPLAFLHVRDTTFSLLPTTCPAPVNSPYGPIHYYSPVIADCQNHRGYVHGIDKDNRHYVLCVEYDRIPAPLTLYYTDPLPEAGFPEIVLTDDGNLMIVGGITYNKGLEGSLENDNFSPLATVFLLRVGNNDVVKVSHGVSGKWLWFVIILAILMIGIVVLMIRRRRNRQIIDTTEPISAIISVSEPNKDSDPNKELMLRVCDLMEQQKPYLNSDLKLVDIAAMLATNRNAISSCINTQRGCSFSQFVNEYRIAYAQKLMRNQPDIKNSEVWMSSGFSTEMSFFRTFKAVTGMTPSEWKTKKD